MNDIAKRNLLATEGRLLALGEESSKLTAAQWLVLYEEVKEDLQLEKQAAKLAYYAERIRKLNRE